MARGKRREASSNTSKTKRPELIDFIYRDSNRIDSYSAQLLGGLLTGKEKHSTEKTGHDKSTSINAAVVQHGEEVASGTERGARDLFTPHDTVAIDVMNTLFSNDFVAKDPVNAPHGSVVRTSGTLMFTDKNMMEMTMKSITAVLKNPSIDLPGDQIALIEMVIESSEHLQFPSAYILKGHQGHFFAGTIKDSGLEEPISSYYYKHGAGGLSQVHLLGIKEVTKAPSLPEHQSFITQTQEMATAMHNLIFPQDAIVVTPIAMFRRL